MSATNYKTKQDHPRVTVLDVCVDSLMYFFHIVIIIIKAQAVAALPLFKGISINGEQAIY